MERFWHWLSHANAKRVLVYSIICLVCASGWWIYKEFWAARLALQTPYNVPVWQPTTSINAMDFIRKQIEAGKTVFGNPFLSRARPKTSVNPQVTVFDPSEFSPTAPPPKITPGLVVSVPLFVVKVPQLPVTLPPIIVSNTTVTVSATSKPPDMASVAPPPTPPTPPAPKKTLDLVYRGMMTRPDGVTVAMIENKSTGKTAFYPQGAKIEWLRVGRIQSRHVEIRSDGGPLVKLPFGAEEKWDEK